MDWIEINNVIPGSPRKVLLCGKSDYLIYYATGELGGSKNAAQITVIGADNIKFTINASHWCELIPPPYLYKDEYQTKRI